ncbi:outer membrane transport energization protein ExbD [Formivibrio citricus]|uniref:Outer membrane transport energization protein ExbD n=1 Tax=Formivibrio citricus TaxID=83765 RepID=A0A1I5CNZ3_9NEIS|nr:biopolymer transporter ExbD [Formivibrio citricus]SFN88709.1 outer membrane transport energization protein ExbD [Formivibrio citricus]
MAFASMEQGDDNEPLAEINMVPLIDVMLVLLIIFMVTAPLLTHSVKLDLPQASSTPNVSKAENIQLAIDAQNRVFWNGKAIGADDLAGHFNAAAKQSPQPELQLRAERSTPYEKVAQVISLATQQGLHRIAFVTDPRPQ